MTDRLEAWLEGHHVGNFEFEPAQPVTFTYDEGAPATPISLSLPRDRPAAKRAAGNFLENLLPDHAKTRERMAAAYGAVSARTYDLLLSAGGDIAGGLVLTPGGEAPSPGPGNLSPADEEDIATRIAAIKRDPDDWAPKDLPARFSLAGTQGKFALADIDGDWYWSNAGVPSTHIVKPARPDLRNLEAAESSALVLARAAGIAASPAEVAGFIDQTAFVTERFDRVSEGDVLRRLHAEDLAQALGEGPGRKYKIQVGAVAELLRDADATGRLARDFVRQVAFNVLIGNADAHAKNYSLLLRPDSISLAPLYDAVPVGLYPSFDQKLAMKIGGTVFPQAAHPALWRKAARAMELDEDEVLGIVAGVAQKVGEHNDMAWDALDTAQAKTLRELIRRNVNVALGE
ncbi:MAG: HipA domain-containing protein [Actinobacteria bacterium]|nr:HipA domain-containing protein [Actinomycetota bacterium]